MEQVDLIVLCRHQETGLGQWGLESVAQQVMRHSPVPLLILNEHEAEMPCPGWCTFLACAGPLGWFPVC